MPAPSDRPLRKVNLNLFADDVAALIARYGNGWTSEVRELVRKDCDAHRSLIRSFDATSLEDHYDD